MALEQGEDHLAAARRELLEETGLSALEDEAEALTRTEAVLRVASTEQFKIIEDLRKEARRPAIAAAVLR